MSTAIEERSEYLPLVTFDQEAVTLLESRWLSVGENHKQCWHNLDITRAFVGNLAKRFALWTVKSPDDLAPSIIGVYKITDVNITAEGPTMTLDASHGSRTLVRHRPLALATGRIFVWLPPFMDVRFAPRDYINSDPKYRRLTWNFSVRMAYDSRQPLVPGEVYFSDAKDLLRIWPDYKL
jgi:hypothetical protein